MSSAVTIEWTTNFLNQFFLSLLQAGLELKDGLGAGAPWPYPYPYPYDPAMGPYAFNG